jgi:hypothetical protein
MQTELTAVSLEEPTFPCPHASVHNKLFLFVSKQIIFDYEIIIFFLSWIFTLTGSIKETQLNQTDAHDTISI